MPDSSQLSRLFVVVHMAHIFPLRACPVLNLAREVTLTTVLTSISLLRERTKAVEIFLEIIRSYREV